MVARRIWLLAGLFLGNVSGALAHEVAEAADEGPWFGNVQFGFLATSGNTDNSNLNSSFQVGYGVGKWVHTFDAFAIKATESNSTTAEAYSLGWRSERNLTERDFVFGRLDWRKDRFSGYTEQFAQTVGYGRRLIDVAPHALNAEIGIGARQAERDDGVNEDNLIVRAGLDYKWQFSETSAFTQTLAVEYGEDNTYVETVSAVTARLVGNLAMVASYTVKHNSDVLPGTEDTDTFSAISLEYQF
jgi:putative salt-induced outer membrane protein